MRGNIDKRKIFLSIVGYWWFSLTFTWLIFEIIEYSFDLSFRGKEIVGGLVVSCSIMLAFLIFKFYPTFESFFEKRKSDEMKYFFVSPDEQFVLSKVLIYSNLYHLNNELLLLDPLIDKLYDEKDYEGAIRIGLYNSSVFYRLSKNYIRVLNGLYVLDALKKWSESPNGSKSKPKYRYIENFIRINDLGWSLYNLKENEINNLIEYLRNHNEIKHFKEEIEIKNYKSSVEKDISFRKKALQENKEFYKLVCQASRHLCGMQQEEKYIEDYLVDFEKYCNKIKNYDDKTEMRSNLNYLKAEISLKKNNTEKAIEYLNLAEFN